MLLDGLETWCGKGGGLQKRLAAFKIELGVVWVVEIHWFLWWRVRRASDAVIARVLGQGCDLEHFTSTTLSLTSVP